MKVSTDEKKLIRVGNYTLTGKMLGKGHFAKVVEAIHTLLNIKVAIKIINIKEINDDYVKNNFRREALILSKLCHPNVIQLCEILETTRNYYLVTEIGEGGDLCTYIRSQMYGKLDERRAQNFGSQLVSAVLHLHDMGIVHRDLKMENILLDCSKEKLKLIDFGLSNICKLNGLLKTHCGSPEYAAPELYISGRKYGPEVDIWSLGVIFYGMLMGKLPFTPCKSDQSQEERRKYLMMETQKGLDAKHQKALQNKSFEFRNLILKMLNPNSKKRITIRELQVHPWVRNDSAKDYRAPETNFQELAILRISRALKIPVEDVISEIKRKPYGAIGGIYNIKKSAYLNSGLKNTEQSYMSEKLMLCTVTNREISSQNEGNNLNTMQRMVETPATCINNTKAVEPKLSTGRVVRFLNEKFSQALNIYSRNPGRSTNNDAAKMKILPTNQRPTSVPNNSIKQSSTRNKCDTINNQLQNTNTDIPKILLDLNPDNGMMRQPNRIRFIPSLNREWIRMNSQGSIQNRETLNMIEKSNRSKSSTPYNTFLRRTIYMNQRERNPDLQNMNKYY